MMERSMFAKVRRAARKGRAAGLNNKVVLIGPYL
jgi:hypothetical protein